MGLKLERQAAPVWVQPLLPVLAIVLTFGLTSVFVLLAGANPLRAYYHFLLEPLSSRVSLLEMLVKATPLLLTGIAVAFAFRGGFWNIGAEGQFLAGATAATAIGMSMHGMPALVAVPLMALGGFVAGMAWAFVPAVMKVELHADEVVTTLLLNTVALLCVSALLNGPWRDPISQWPQSPEIASTAILPKLVPRSRLHLGFLFAVFVVLVVGFILTQTTLGLRMRAVGLEPKAARFAGVRVERTLLVTALVSGGVAGFAGMVEVAGIHYRLIEAISGGHGYTGILVATLGNLSPLGVVLSALFVGLIDIGSQTVSRALGVPVYLGDVIQATLLLVTLAVLLLQNYRLSWRRGGAL
ncbi:MAG: ABC transporter permease [Anaerolineae bacterium]|nr:ABC transporter permease [Thermoflexales bacterium]MDW8395985.1 ABC transporter permease [Anaerolineae bacterium]